MVQSGQVMMVFGAHADDMEILAGGTAAKYAAQGWNVISVMMTNNLCGASTDETPPRRLGPEETREVRHREAREAAQVLGVSVEFLDYKENSYWNGEKRVLFGTPEYEAGGPPGKEALMAAQCLDPCIREVADLLVRHSPEVVITHSIANCNPEHCAAASTVHKAFLRARKEAPLGSLWFSARIQSASDVMMLSPDIIIDITDFLEVKLRALVCHRSQRLPLDRIRAQHEFWGRLAGVNSGEPFRSVLSGRHV